MKPTCDLCPREATRWYVPGDDARCGLHERSESASVPLTRRPPPPDAAACALCRGPLRPGVVVCSQCETGGYSGPVGRGVPLALPAFEPTSADSRVWTLSGVATVRPPADERCPRCSRILIAAPCGCLSAAQRWVAMQTEADALWRAMSSAEHVEAVRLKAAARGREQERAPCT